VPKEQNLIPRVQSSPLLKWKPQRSQGFAIGAGLFVILAAVKAAFISRWLPRAEMTAFDLPQFWTLAASSPPWRPFSAAEVVILRHSIIMLQFLVSAAVCVVVYVLTKRRAHAEAALVSYCLELEQALEGSFSSNQGSSASSGT
jgi:hypothetical protein